MSAITIYKRIRHLVNNDLRLTPENQTEERKTIREYLIKVEELLEERYKKFTEQVQAILLSQETTTPIQNYIRGRYNNLSKIHENPWALEEMPQQENSTSLPTTISKNPLQGIDLTTKVLQIVSEIPKLEAQ